MQIENSFQPNEKVNKIKKKKPNLQPKAIKKVFKVVANANAKFSSNS